jgi:hypothetical protein
MGYYEANLRLLSLKEPILTRRLEWVRGLPPPKDHQIHFPIPDGIDLSRSNTVVVLGFGDGEHIREILKRISRKGLVLVIDPDIARFKYILSSRDLSFCLSHPNISLSIGESPVDATRKRLDDAYGINTITEIEVISHPPSMRGREGYFREVVRGLQDVANSASHNLSTLSDSAKMWFANILENLPSLMVYPGVKGLFGRFRGIPAFILGGGPSLDRHLHLLNDIKGRGLIIACDTALRTLSLDGIEPDLLLSLDGREESYRHFDGVGVRDSFLVAFSITHPRIISDFPGGVFMSDFPHPLNEYLSLFIGKKGYLKSGGSVTTACFDLARMCGANPIVFVGLDLAFPNDLTHSSATFYIEEMLSRIDRFHTLEMFHRERARGEGRVWVEAVGGGKVATSRKLLAYLRWFEAEIGSSGDLIVINTGEEGARIKGTYDMKLEEVISKFCNKRHKIEETIRSVCLSYTSASSSSIRDGLKRLLGEFRDVDGLSKRGRICADHLIKLIDKGDTPNVGRIFGEISRLYREIISRDLFIQIGRFNLEPLLTRMEGAERQDRMGRARLSQYFFGSINEYCHSAMKLVEKALENL